MTKETKTKKPTSKADNESIDDETLNTLGEEGMEVVDQDEAGAEDGETESVNLDDFSLDEFMSHPEKLAKLTDDSDVEESTNWCPQCSDHTIFVNRVCTVCGFTKGASKKLIKDENDEEESTSFEILPDDDIVGGLGYNDEFDGDDY